MTSINTAANPVGDANDSVLAYEVPAAAQAIGLSRAYVFNLIRDGHLRSFKVGRRRLIPAADLKQFIADRLAEEATAR